MSEEIKQVETSVDPTTIKEKDRCSKGKSRFKGKKSFDKGSSRKAGNDFAFWNQFPELMDSVTRIPWNYIPGTAQKFTDNNLSFENVIRVNYIPTIGISQNATDPFNLEFRDLWLQMHRKYRGLGKYQQSDLSIAMLCIASVFVAIVQAERIYGVYHSYPVNNRITPRGILLAMGYDADLLDSIETHLSDYRSSLNRLILKAGRLVLPEEFNALKSWISLSAFLYTDSQDKRASVIAFISDAFYAYSATDFSTGSAAYTMSMSGYLYECKAKNSGVASYEHIIKFIDYLLERLLSDDDISIMCSDLLAAFGEQHLEVLKELPENYVITPVYSESILFKFHNMEWLINDYLTYFNTADAAATEYATLLTTIQTNLSDYATAARAPLVIYQKDNVVINRLVEGVVGAVDDCTGQSFSDAADGQQYTAFPGNGESVNSGFATFRDHILNTWKQDPGKEDVCEGVLWKVCAKQHVWTDMFSTTYPAYIIANCGTELIARVTVETVAGSAISAPQQVEHAVNGAPNARISACAMTKFDWHPFVKCYNYTFVANLPSGWNLVNIYGDVDNFTTVDDTVIAKILDTALLSAFTFKIQGKADMR